MRMAQVTDVAGTSRFDVVRDHLKQLYPGRMTPQGYNGNCHQRAEGMAGLLRQMSDGDPSRTLVANVVFDGVFNDGGKPFYNQHIAVRLKPAYSGALLQRGDIISPAAIDTVVDADRPGTDALSLGAWNALYGGLPIQYISAGWHIPRL
ncbi:MAG: hypothetical protein AAFU77_04070 [Myxococcota bacterium]